jgi:predicted dienelactone hydrolase
MEYIFVDRSILQERDFYGRERMYRRNIFKLADYCRTHTSNDWDICGLQDEIQKLYPGKRVIDESDSRIKAALSLAPDGYEWFLEDGMAKIKVPIMIVGGGADDICPVETHV